MRSFHTLDDLKNADEDEVKEALKQVTVKNDLFSYLKWLYSPEGTVTEGTFRLGHHDRGLGLHPSAFAKPDACPLKLYYDCTGEVEAARSFDFEAQLTYDIGTLTHCMLQTHFVNMYRDQFEEEVWLKSKRLLITSHTDGRFNFSKIRFLLEIKSIKEGGNFGFAKVQDRPFPDNVRQLMTYMRLDKCPFGLLFYFCKNNGEIKEHPIVYSAEMWKDMKMKQILPVIQAVEDGEPPTPRVGYHCKKCEYFHGCKHGKGYFNDARQARRANTRTAVLPGKRQLRFGRR